MKTGEHVFPPCTTSIKVSNARRGATHKTAAQQPSTLAYLDVVLPGGRERHGVLASRGVVHERNADGRVQHLIFHPPKERKGGVD